MGAPEQDATQQSLERIWAELKELRHEQESRREVDLANARLAAIVESSDDAIISKSLDGVVRTWNEGAARIFGYTAKEMVGQPIMKLLPVDRQTEEIEILSRLRRGERVEHFETQRVTKDGRLIDVSLSISPIRDPMGVIVGASKIARDITAQKRYERELAEAKEAAEQANAAKDHFLAVLSHELRTPLMPVLAGLALLERGAVGAAELPGELATMRRHVSLEVQLIDDLLDHTRIARGKMQLAREVTSVNDLVKAVCAMCAPEAEEKRQTLECRLGAEAPWLWGDAKRLQQVLWNLLKNAIKFTPSGGRIELVTLNEMAGGRWLKVEVRDTGIGLTPEQMGKVFEPFVQGGKMITRVYGGLGLGLTITKSFVELHGGRMEVESAGAGKGATFRVMLPRALAEAEIAVPRAALPGGEGNGREFRKRSVLLVEDHADTRRMLARLLRARGHTVALAGSVSEARGILAGQRFDVLVSDIGLPDGSGTEVMEAARGVDGGIYGIAVTGFGMPEDERVSREAGFAMHMAKPVDPEKLEEAIERAGTGSLSLGIKL